jgi:predicted kinase
VWLEIEEKVITEIREAIAQGYSVIYDATNAKRGWRMEMLMKLGSLQVGAGVGTPTEKPNNIWMAWYFQTPLEKCKEWNQKRDRKVPEIVIEKMYQSLQDFPPISAEGFAIVNPIDVTSSVFGIEQIETEIKTFSRRVINRTNRNSHITLHSYSKLVDFERLMHLISLIIRYPGLGNLQTTHPDLVESIFGTAPMFASSLDEITAFMGKLCGRIYADKDAIALDLDWLQQNGLIGNGTYASIGNPDKNLFHSPVSSTDISIKYPYGFPAHTYSDLDTFTRLVQIIRFILHHPFLPKSEPSSLKTLVTALRENGIIAGDGLDTVRKDIEKVLKPYKILPNFPLRDGYFAGTAILSKQELIKVFGVLQSQAKSLDDPIALDIYETFAERMAQSKQEVAQVYPVRGIANRCIVDPEFLPKDALYRNLQLLEEAIAKGQLLELNRFPGGGKFAGDKEGFFLAYPLQIVFYSLAWYLGFECEGPKDSGLFRFERLDRLFIGQPQGKVRSREEQEKSLQKLQKLCSASAGIFLGYSVSDQQEFLSKNKQEREKVCVTVELWFNDTIFRFVAEGTKRFPPQQMKMSPPVEGGKIALPKSIFSLSQTGDNRFPNRFRVVLPNWCLNDVDFLRWIVGFGGNVKVVQPQELVDKVKKIGEAIVKVYA